MFSLKFQCLCLFISWTFPSIGFYANIKSHFETTYYWINFKNDFLLISDSVSVLVLYAYVKTKRRWTTNIKFNPLTSESGNVSGNDWNFSSHIINEQKMEIVERNYKQGCTFVSKFTDSEIGLCLVSTVTILI